MDSIKKFFKELKRVRWPKPVEANKSFRGVIIFATVAALVLFGIAVGLAALWNAWGVGLNG